jgi:hypothetical protein
MKEKKMNKEKNIPFTISINFNELTMAFEQSANSTHYFIDLESNRIICIDELKDSDARTKLSQMRNNKRYIKIPQHDIRDEQLVMETFIYEPRDFILVDTLYKTLHRKNGVKLFYQLLESQPHLKEQWLTYRSAALRNEMINWLCNNNIELTSQYLIPTIEIKEITAEEIELLPDEIKDFKPYACLHCHNEKGMKTRIFTINVSPENMLIEQETQRIMKERFGITHHGGWSGGEQEFLTASRCPRCGCEEIFWDY